LPVVYFGLVLWHSFFLRRFKACCFIFISREGVNMKHIIVMVVSVLIALIHSANVDADQQIIMEIEGMTCKL
jgi:hypothetical protein